MPAERAAEPGLIELAYTRGIPLVASNEPFFATREDYEAHDALLCIAEGRLIADGERRQLTPEHRFKSRAEMAALFADLPEALAATVEIAQRCAYRPRTLAPILPRFSTAGETGRGPETLAAKQVRDASEAQDEAQELRRAAAAGLERGSRATRWRQATPPRITASGSLSSSASSRSMKYAGYFLIVADFIQWAKAQGIPVGPGPRLGRRLAGRLCAHHHRSRSDPLRASVRALPQSRAHLDAGLRHRFLPGPARRGDPLRAGEIRRATRSPRSSPSARCRRAACCATSAACCRCRMGRSTASASWCRTIRPLR